MWTERSPFQAFSATGRADIAWVGHRGYRAVEPFARPRADPVFRFLKPRHHQAQTWRRGRQSNVLVRLGCGKGSGVWQSGDNRRRWCAQGLFEVAARFAPQLRIERSLRQSKMGFARIGVLRREPLETLQPVERRRAVVDGAVNL